MSDTGAAIRTPRTSATENEFLSTRSLTWLDVAAKSHNVFVDMRQLERELIAATERVKYFEEKADAISRYLLEKKSEAVLAVVTELSLDAQRRAPPSERKNDERYR